MLTGFGGEPAAATAEARYCHLEYIFDYMRTKE